MKKLLVIAGIIATSIIAQVAVGLPQASAAASIKCGTDKTYGWVTEPVNGLKVGAKYCRTMTGLANKNGTWAYWFTATNGTLIPTSNNQPNWGGPTAAAKAHAKAAKNLAAKYGLHVAFTKYTGHRDSMGWVNKNGVGLAGTYYPSRAYPGKGLIELSNGGNSLSAADAKMGKTAARERILDTLRHEIAHARIELKCGTTRPPITVKGDRHEHITDAYAVTFLGRNKASMHYGYTKADLEKAKKIAKGICE